MGQINFIMDLIGETLSMRANLSLNEKIEILEDQIYFFTKLIG
jgi:hypothetical protein